MAGKRRRRLRVVGAYELPDRDDVFLIEAIIPAAPHDADMAQFAPYRPRGWDSDWEVGWADFYLSDDGEQLIGSYLEFERPEHARDPSVMAKLQRSLRLPASTRVAFLMDGLPDAFYTCWGVARLPEVTPVPERLLRLIWLE